MYTVLSLAYELIVQLLPFCGVLWFFRKKQTRQDRIVAFTFAVYIIAVFHVTGAGTFYDALRFEIDYLYGRVNLIPFSRKIDTFGYILNVLMFVPFGFLLAAMWKFGRKLYGILAAGFSFSLLIELSQILCLRGTDVDDLIMNTLGAVLGFLIHRWGCRCFKRQFVLEGKDSWEIVLYILALFLGRFFLFHQLGFINLYYGF